MLGIDKKRFQRMDAFMYLVGMMYGCIHLVGKMYGCIHLVGISRQSPHGTIQDKWGKMEWRALKPLMNALFEHMHKYAFLALTVA